ncbi:hypothetical protein AB0G81_05895 [Streptomyces asoensis]|uniref:hypothetical protein n=1 Tax=Streptomyces asoensis TaxID=249586 RepID=UPI0033FC2CB3
MEDDALRFLCVDPAALEAAPDRLARADSWPRIDVHSSVPRRFCSCRALAVATRVFCSAGYGPRWHDQCRNCLIAGIRLTWEAGTPMEGRYKVTLLVDGRPVMEGWWQERAVAERKYLAWIGEHGSSAKAQATLTDEEGGVVLTSWPDGP